MTDDWCVAYDMGKHDHIIVDSVDYRVCRSYVTHCQQYYDKPLKIALAEDLRILHEKWIPVEFCTGGRVTNPDRQ